MMTSPGAREWQQQPTGHADTRVLVVVVTLVMIGLIVVCAATYHRGFGYLKWHGVRASIGLAALLVGMQLRHTKLARRGRWWLLGVSAGLLFLTLFIGVVVGAARRWLDLNILSVQPAEFAKYALVIWLAAYFAALRESGGEWNFKNTIIKPGVVALPIIGLTLAQPAVGTSVIMALSCIILLYIVGVRRLYVGVLALLGILLVVLAIRFVPHARDRWNKFVSGNRYHQEQSLIGIGSGELAGVGLGEGKQKYYFLPKMHNDFIFSAIGEEFGFLGSLGVYLLFALLFLRGMKISRETSGLFGQYLAAGISVVLFLYALVHVAVGVGLIPTTGQPLPFISFGGSALVTNLFAAGILLNVSKFQRTRMKVQESPRTLTAHTWVRPGIHS